MINKHPYEKIIELNAKVMELQKKINNLKPTAIKQLYKMGYCMDTIATMLKTGKVNVVAILNNSKIKIGNVGRSRKTK